MSADPATVTAPVLPAGAVLNEMYQIVNVLGGGGFGITYLAWDSVREKHVVIKECLPGDYACRVEGSYDVRPISDGTTRMFYDCLVNARQEAETLAQFSNKGVVQVFDLFDENGTFYYTMEYIQGKTLYEVMMAMRAKGERMSPEQAEGLLVYVLEILEHLHRQKIYHCDIKPGNIFIMPDGMPKLIDFGAVRSKELQHQGLVQITPGYTPPEFYPGSKRELGAWSDIYELGATFYELMTGVVPEPSDQRFKVDRMVKISSMENLRNIYPLVFLSSIDKALSPDLHERFKTASAWIDYLDSYGSGRQIRTVNPHSSVGARFIAAGVSPVLKKKKKSNAPFIVLVLVVVAMIVGGVANHNGSINLDAYPQLSFLKSWLNAPNHEKPAGDEVKTPEKDDKDTVASDNTPEDDPFGGEDPFATDFPAMDDTDDTQPGTSEEPGNTPEENPEEPSGSDSPVESDDGDIIIEE